MKKVNVRKSKLALIALIAAAATICGNVLVSASTDPELSEAEKRLLSIEAEKAEKAKEIQENLTPEEREAYEALGADISTIGTSEQEVFGDVVYMVNFRKEDKEKDALIAEYEKLSDEEKEARKSALKTEAEDTVSASNPEKEAADENDLKAYKIFSKYYGSQYSMSRLITDQDMDIEYMRMMVKLIENNELSDDEETILNKYISRRVSWIHDDTLLKEFEKWDPDIYGCGNL